MMTAILMALIVAGVSGPEQTPPNLDGILDLDGSKNIMEETHFGIANGLLSIGVNYKDAAAVSGLWSPPYVSSDFLIEVTFLDKGVPTANYTWRPFEVKRSGVLDDLRIAGATTLLYGSRAGILSLSILNPDSEKKVPIEIRVRGTLDRASEWGFARPESATPAPGALVGDAVVKEQGGQAIVLRTDLEAAAWDVEAQAWRTDLPLAAGKEKTFHIVFAVGATQEALATAQKAAANLADVLGQTQSEYAGRLRGLFDRLPRLESSNAALVGLYNRSLVPFLLNRWETPEFLLHPCYTTGSVKGGCVCDYLWDYGEPWEILPLYDPDAVCEHIKQFLKIDLTAHFAFDPITGNAQGPWYPVNQEKIIGSVYYYVLNTGDLDFLKETVAGKTVLDWVLDNATFGDDPAKPAVLIDYGPSNSHLELRRGFPYNHIMPDLNGRRYANYLMASELAERAGRPVPSLKERAEALKELLKQRLWDPEKKWFHFEDETGKKDLRYTVQMFKLFNSAVLDSEEEAGLLTHLNETEFLSEQGLHSMSKTDIAYDQVDIDNGGGGCYTGFPPQIAERLYKAAHANEADDVLRRILWWGERLPYWGDSLVANSVDYRKDTPLQCTISGPTVAQCVIFGMFGVSADFDGAIVIDPHPPAFAQDITLKNLRLRGHAIDIAVRGGTYTVLADGNEIRSGTGQQVKLSPLPRPFSQANSTRPSPSTLVIP